MNEVKCNNCNWEGLNSDLVKFEDENGVGGGCPHCKTDSYLTNLFAKCGDCGVEITAEDFNETEGMCEVCYNKKDTVIRFDVIEDNGYGITENAGTHEVEGITLEEAKKSIEYYTELYTEHNSGKTEFSFLSLDNPREV